MPFLGEIPLVMSIRESSDAGRPVVAPTGQCRGEAFPRYRPDAAGGASAVAAAVDRPTEVQRQRSAP